MAGRGVELLAEIACVGQPAAAAAERLLIALSVPREPGGNEKFSCFATRGLGWCGDRDAKLLRRLCTLPAPPPDAIGEVWGPAVCVRDECMLWTEKAGFVRAMVSMDGLLSKRWLKGGKLSL